MPLPPFLTLASEVDYRNHFINTYVQAQVQTRDGIRVHFKRENFGHAFFESSNRDGKKDQFSADRAKRINWILHTITDAGADWYQGWNKWSKSYEITRPAIVACGDFVVVLKFRARRDGVIVANFVTCYYADNSIGKIRTSPPWTFAGCQIALGV